MGTEECTVDPCGKSKTIVRLAMHDPGILFDLSITLMADDCSWICRFERLIRIMLALSSVPRTTLFLRMVSAALPRIWWRVGSSYL